MIVLNLSSYTLLTNTKTANTPLGTTTEMQYIVNKLYHVELKDLSDGPAPNSVFIWPTIFAVPLV